MLKRRKDEEEAYHYTCVGFTLQGTFYGVVELFKVDMI